jgi:SAM-dependent methyltransferase
MTVTRDGSPVEFYRRLPASGEPELIHAVVPPGASVLDLGCGTGRIAAPLARLGHRVTGVDDAPAMIAALPAEVEGVVGDARHLRLERRYGAVLLASHVVNDPDDGAAFVATAAAHLDRGGVAVGEAYPPDWDPVAAVGRVTRMGDATVELVRAAVDGGLVDAEVRYAVDGREWRQSFEARLLDEEALRGVLGAGGLVFERWLERPGWFVATRGQAV